MSSSSCYDDSPTELSDDEYDTELDDTDVNDEKTVVITQTKVIARRYESWHEKFLTYNEILDYLVKLSGLYKHKCCLEHLGISKEDRPIFMIRIISGTMRPAMSIMIEAGSNGQEKMTVSTVLYLIDYLVKGNINFLAEYMIIPCLNPDAYDKCLKLSKQKMKNLQNINLSKSFPKNCPLPTNYGMAPSSPNLLVTQASAVPTNCQILMDTLAKYKTRIRLFISLQASESSLTYPLDYYIKEIFQYAVASKTAMGWDAMDVKPIVPSLTETKGTSVEYVIRNFHSYIKFAYILNIHNKNFVPDESFILPKGEQTLYGILTLSKKVYKYLNIKKSRKYNVKTIVKLLDTTDA